VEEEDLQSVVTTFIRFANPLDPCPSIHFCVFVPDNPPLAMIWVHDPLCIGLFISLLSVVSSTPRDPRSGLGQWIRGGTYMNVPPLLVIIFCNCRFETLGPVDPLR